MGSIASKCLPFLKKFRVKGRNAMDHMNKNTSDQIALKQQQENNYTSLGHVAMEKLDDKYYDKEGDQVALNMEQTSDQQIVKKMGQEQNKITLNPEEIRNFIDSTPEFNEYSESDIKDLSQKSFLIVDELLNKGQDLFEKICDNPDGLTVWAKSSKTQEGFYVNALKYNYTLDATLDQYKWFMNDIELQKQIESSVDTFERIYGTPECGILYLRYKKVLFMDPREFLYLKSARMLSENVYMETSKSIEIMDFEPKILSKKKPVKGVMLISGSVIEQINPNQLQVTTYSECDMKLKMAPQMMLKTSVNELKKYIEKIQKQINRDEL